MTIPISPNQSQSVPISPNQSQSVPISPNQSQLIPINPLFRYQENRAADHIFGCILGDHPEFDGIPTGGRQLNKVPFKPELGQVNVTCGSAPYVCGGGMAEADARTERGAGQQPLYDTFAGHFKPGTNSKTYPYAPQSDEYSVSNGATGGSIQMFSAEQLPVKKAISEHFGVFNKLYCATPTSSTPNHHFTQSGTSCGSTNNNDYQQCGGKTVLFPQMAMYDTMWLDNVSFGCVLVSHSSAGVHTLLMRTFASTSLVLSMSDVACCTPCRGAPGWTADST
eukprot:SAG31_NODE_1899_length_6960_cov_18.360880_6_plen_280_part_00